MRQITKDIQLTTDGTGTGFRLTKRNVFWYDSSATADAVAGQGRNSGFVLRLRNDIPGSFDRDLC